MSYEPLTEESSFPYGKHKGVAMANVPDEYLLWVFENDRCSESVKTYITERIDAIRANVAANKEKGLRH